MQPKASAPAGAVAPITPNSEFYVEDIHGPPKSLHAKNWHLKVTGKVDRPLTLSLDQIRKRPTVRQIITLSCIGNPVGGYALGNAEWEGISLRDLLDEADPDFFTKTLIFKGADGYHDSIPLSRGRHRAALAGPHHEWRASVAQTWFSIETIGSRPVRHQASQMDP